MSDHTYESIEITGSSAVSSDDAVKKIVTHAGKTMRGRV